MGHLDRVRHLRLEKQESYRLVMDIIVRANRGKFEEVKGMCDALMELMKDELDERERQGEIRGEKIFLIPASL